MSLADLIPGAIFASDFRVSKLLARGGMCAVYVVEQLSTNRKRALKLMHHEHVSSQGLVDKFEKEMKILSQIDSDHVAQVLSGGVDTASGVPWLAMELLEGETLEQKVERSGALVPSEVL